MYLTSQVELIGLHLPEGLEYLDLNAALALIAKRLGEHMQPAQCTNLLTFLISNKYCQAIILAEFEHIDKSGGFIIEAHTFPYVDPLEGQMGFSFDTTQNRVFTGALEGTLRIPRFGFERGLDAYIRDYIPDLSLDSTRKIVMGDNARSELIKNIFEEAIAKSILIGEPISFGKIPGTRKDFAEFLRKKYPELFKRYDQKWMEAEFKSAGLKFSPGRTKRIKAQTIWERLFPEDFLI